MTKHNLKESLPITEKETTKVCLSGSESSERMNQTHRVDWMPVQSQVMQNDTVGVENSCVAIQLKQYTAKPETVVHSFTMTEKALTKASLKK